MVCVQADVELRWERGCGGGGGGGGESGSALGGGAVLCCALVVYDAVVAIADCPPAVAPSLES